jgi:ribulose-5-phosphate 4-epimerase/fuculose-1-phosphate aldolase
VEWKGEFPELSHQENIPRIMKTQFQIRDTAREIVLKVKSSPNHLILSKNLPQEDLIMITATQTNKLTLSPLSELPFVRCIPKDKKVLYYGDKEKWPSSETMTMWAIFNKMNATANSDCSAIIHAHTPHLTVDYAWKHQGINDGKYIVPLVEWQHFGEPELGENIARSMLETPTHAVLLDDHGPFIIGDSFKEAYELLTKLEEVASHGKKP